MSQWLNRFPFEIRAAILGQLSLRNLASVSLVCREWQLSAFPSLYHTVYICKLTHLEVLAQRMLVENVLDMLSVPMYSRCLRLGGSGRWLGSNNLHYLDAIVPRLIHLNCLYWELGFMPSNLDLFSKCPALKSFHLVPNVFSIHPVDNWIRRLPQLLRFTNLTHFSLQSANLPDESNKEYLESLRSLFQSSPNLESIKLRLQDYEDTMETYSLTCILESLGDQFVLPRLHTFHMLGAADPDWFRFASEPTHPLRSFLTRHTSIRDLAIGRSMDTQGVGMNSDDLSQMLPSVKHLALPTFMFESIIKSQLATQIESLAITDSSLSEKSLAPAVEVMMQDALPNLRKLSIWANRGELDAAVLEIFFSAAKGLEELDSRVGVDNYENFKLALYRAGKLRQITLDPEEIMRHGVASKIQWEDLMLELADVCPRLEIVISQGERNEWRVVRGGNIDTLIQMSNHSLF